jgi:hypothetical protein
VQYELNSLVRRVADIAGDTHAQLLARAAMAEEANDLYAARLADLERQLAELRQQAAEDADSDAGEEAAP